VINVSRMQYWPRSRISGRQSVGFQTRLFSHSCDSGRPWRRMPMAALKAESDAYVERHRSERGRTRLCAWWCATVAPAHGK
jgi:hypothetical protein